MTGIPNSTVLYDVTRQALIDRFSPYLKSFINGFVCGVEATYPELELRALVEAYETGGWGDDYSFVIIILDKADSFEKYSVAEYVMDFEKTWQKSVDYYKKIYPDETFERIEEYTTATVGYGPPEVQERLRSIKEEVNKEEIMDQLSFKLGERGEA